MLRYHVYIPLEKFLIHSTLTSLATLLTPNSCYLGISLGSGFSLASHRFFGSLRIACLCLGRCQRRRLEDHAF